MQFNLISRQRHSCMCVWVAREEIEKRTQEKKERCFCHDICVLVSVGLSKKEEFLCVFAFLEIFCLVVSELLKYLLSLSLIFFLSF
ncbi:hypothetical protein L1887_24011 [Cichorium endivia]|nr:hypothetical protein L1887_24011 [Cichorium endivia]